MISKQKIRQKVKNSPQLSLADAGIRLPEMTMSDTEFMTGDEKMKVLRHWEAFLGRGCRWQDFTEALYHHLELHCAFIAHYDRRGFYEYYFSTGDGIKVFLVQFDRGQGCPAVEIGLTFWVCYPGMNDINNTLCDIAARYIPALTQLADSRQRKADVARAELLLSKHGLKIQKKQE